MALFSKNRRVDVPEIDVRGNEATIQIERDAMPTPGMEREVTEEPMAPWTKPSDPEPPQSRTVNLPKTIWSES